MPHTNPNAQHVPPGWTFPTLAVAAPPAAHVVGGGGAGATTVTRLRWGRLLPLFAGLLLVAWGLWSVSQDTTPVSSTVSGGGTSEVDIARAARADAPKDSTGDSSTAADAAATAAVPDATPPARAARPAARPGARSTTPRTGVRGARRVAPAAALARTTPAIAATPAAAPTARGGGGPNGELPLTGIETWIAAILGVLLLGVGICVHVNAVRLAATALLYRRGILLRPVDCARLAQERGVPQARVVLSNLLHRLLEEPARGDFVGMRMAR